MSTTHFMSYRTGFYSVHMIPGYTFLVLHGRAWHGILQSLHDFLISLFLCFLRAPLHGSHVLRFPFAQTGMEWNKALVEGRVMAVSGLS